MSSSKFRSRRLNAQSGNLTSAALYVLPREVSGDRFTVLFQKLRNGGRGVTTFENFGLRDEIFFSRSESLCLQYFASTAPYPPPLVPSGRLRLSAKSHTSSGPRHHWMRFGRKKKNLRESVFFPEFQTPAGKAKGQEKHSHNSLHCAR